MREIVLVLIFDVAFIIHLPSYSRGMCELLKSDGRSLIWVLERNRVSQAGRIHMQGRVRVRWC